MPPAPLPTTTPMFSVWGSMPASANASRAARTAMRETFAYRRGSARPPPLPWAASSPRSAPSAPAAASDASGTDARTRDVNCDASNSVTARVPLRPRLTDDQNRSRPTPNGETTPMPVIATRGSATGHLVPIIGGMPRLPVTQPVGHLAVATLGGLTFVASLAYFALSYTGRFGVVLDPASGPARSAVIVDAALFTAFALHHSIFARAG